MKSEDLSADFQFTPWSLDLFIHVTFQLHREHTVQQPFPYTELIVHNAISVLLGIYLQLSQVKHVRVKCLAQDTNIETMSQSRKPAPSRI